MNERINYREKQRRALEGHLWDWNNLIAERDAAQEDLKTLREACEWPTRTDMSCNYCGMFSSTMHCQACLTRLSQMYRFLLHERGIINALNSPDPMPIEERTT